MKKIIAVAVLITMMLGSCAHTPPKHVSMIGDSITFLSTPVILSTLESAGYQVDINGVPGARVDEMQGWADTFAAKNPEQLVINLGTNDVNQAQVNLKESAHQIQIMRDKFIGVQCTHLVTITESTLSVPVNDRAVDLNSWMRAQPETKIVDWAAYIKDHPDEHLTSDFVHPNDEGQRVLANLIKVSLDSC